MKNLSLLRTITRERVERVVATVNRKKWWHVPPRDPSGYHKRGKFLASTYREAEFWGRPLDHPQRVTVAKPLVGDEATIERILFGRRKSHENISMEQRWRLDGKMKRAAIARGYDSIVLMAPQGLEKFRITGTVPRSLELNILAPSAT